MSSALFERSASLRLTWLFWFFLCQGKKNTKANYEIEKQTDKRQNANYEKRYAFMLKKYASYQPDEISPIV